MAALADLHCTKTSQGAFQPLFAAHQRVGRHAAARRRSDRLRPARGSARAGQGADARCAFPRRPCSAITISSRARPTRCARFSPTPASIVLDGDACEMLGIGIAGVKGFGGGFGKRALGPWGETIIKQFVHEAVDEALKLEAALARLRTDATRRAAALLADSADGRRRAAGDLSVSRIEPAGGADRPISGVARRARPRAPRPARRRDQERRARSTTSRCRC